MSSVKGPDNARDQEFERIVTVYQEAILRMCYLHLKDRSLAEDAVQETFLKIYRSMTDFRGESHEKTWIMRIAINTCYDMNKSAWQRFMDKRITPDMMPETGAPVQQEEENLVMNIMALPPKLRQVFVLYYYQGMSTLEISQSLGIAQSSVSNRLKRGREKLRRALEGRDQDA